MSFLLESPESVEGIGPQRARVLATAGIETLAEMLAAGAARVAKLIPAASHAQVGSWFCAAALRRIEGVTPDIAEALVGGGLRSVRQVADADLRSLESSVKQARDAGRLQADVSLYALADLQRAAWKARDQGTLAGRILDKAGAPIAGALVDLGRPEFTTGADGRYAFDGLPAGTIRPMLSLPGRSRPLFAQPQTIRPGKLTGPVLHRIGDPPSQALPPLTADEMDGELPLQTERSRNREVILPLAEFREGTHFLVREIKPGGDVRLLSLYKARLDETTLVKRAVVRQAQLPSGAAVDSVVVLQSGALAATSLTATDVAEMRHQKWLQAHPSRTRRVVNLP